PQQFDRQIMKWSRANVHRAMNVGRLRKPDVAKFPLRFCRWSRGILKPQIRIAQCDDYIVVSVDMPQSRVAGRYGDIPHAHELVFKFRVMMRLAFDFDWRLR